MLLIAGTAFYIFSSTKYAVAEILDTSYGEWNAIRHGGRETVTKTFIKTGLSPGTHQTYKATFDWEGHGHQDGSAQITIDMCFMPSGWCQGVINFDPGDSNCSQSDGRECNNRSGFETKDTTSADLRNNDYLWVSLFVRDSEIYVSGDIFSRRVVAGGVSVSDTTLDWGQNFIVSWSGTSEDYQGTKFFYEGPFSCTVLNGAAVSSNGFVNCTALNQNGSGRVYIQSTGPGGNGAETVESNHVSITNTQPPFVCDPTLTIKTCNVISGDAWVFQHYVSCSGENIENCTSQGKICDPGDGTN
ncbi:MAG: hypothetical protein IH859_08010, partial [Chloroflexi bacterium]|nr:hypothetical protein [Chloroflexota bacterium]